jgi:hypothetical protein
MFVIKPSFHRFLIREGQSNNQHDKRNYVLMILIQNRVICLPRSLCELFQVLAFTRLHLTMNRKGYEGAEEMV